MKDSSDNLVKFDAQQHQLACLGEWNLANLPLIQASLEEISFPTSGQITIEGGAIKKMDSAGAWLLGTWVSQLKEKSLTITVQNFAKPHQSLLGIVDKQLLLEGTLTQPVKPNFVTSVGMNTVAQLQELNLYLTMVGRLSLESLRVLTSTKRFRIGALSSVIYRNGYQALPIIAVLSFMIGVVLTYQMGLQLKNYGANIFIVDLMGLAVLREFGPLLTAIMVAGRTGASYTAQLGMMKLNEEIDALDTMGVTPGELLLLPRIGGLVLALPLLTIWADMMGIFGGMVMSNNLLNITLYDFLHRFSHLI